MFRKEMHLDKGSPMVKIRRRSVGSWSSVGELQKVDLGRGGRAVWCWHNVTAGELFYMV